MNLRISTIADRGIPNKERLILEVLQDTDLSYYTVFDTFYLSQDRIATHPKGAYWFDPKKVRAGDLIILYTRTGIPSEKQNPDGTKWHFFFWGLKNTTWNRPGDCAVLVQMTSWETSKPG
jgi:hypothetical protein